MGNSWCRCCKKKNIPREAFKTVHAHEIRDLMQLVFTTPHWKDFLDYCARCGVDGQEVCNWTDAILDKEYQISDPRVRENILDIKRETMIQLWLQAASKRQ